MKNRTKVLIGVALSMMLMGGAYATWTEGFEIKNYVGTYEFDYEVVSIAEDGEEVKKEAGKSKHVKASFRLNNENPEILVRNTGTVPIYIDHMVLNYKKNYEMENPNNYSLIKTLVFEEIGSEGSDDKRIDAAVKKLFKNGSSATRKKTIQMGRDHFEILPAPKEDGVEDLSERSIQLERKINLSDLIGEYASELNILENDAKSLEDQIQSARNAMDSNPDLDIDIGSMKHVLGEMKDRITELESIIKDITNAYEKDEIEVKIFFKMAN